MDGSYDALARRLERLEAIAYADKVDAQGCDGDCCETCEACLMDEAYELDALFNRLEVEDLEAQQLATFTIEGSQIALETLSSIASSPQSYTEAEAIQAHAAAVELLHWHLALADRSVAYGD